MREMLPDLWEVEIVSWICFCCDEIVYDEAWPHGDKTLCDDCYWDMREAECLKVLEEE
jgi:hypothetical protein